ncbi:phosphohistidine phosphatase SixA [Spartinivicinus ruber]|uniref:phosphohistidine phosphatase SixA n=1 Tax=Spartinivicinus ruber TaxID=2683272 RepID=UPI0013D6F78D|nr:phosphohistidine phosphatase SixA [Spartinivicinus ruber]
MRLYFVQHGVAVDKDVNAERPLSKVGHNESTKVAVYLKQHNVNIKKICHSEKLRAKQTAAVFAENLNVNSLVEVTGMSPNDDPNILVDNLLEDGAMYVGHLPNLEKVVSQLVADNKASDVIQFQNSAVACVEVEAGQGSILWFIPPMLA